MNCHIILCSKCPLLADTHAMQSLAVVFLSVYGWRSIPNLHTAGFYQTCLWPAYGRFWL